MNSTALPLLLAVDVGNSRVKLGLFERAGRSANGTLPRCLCSQAAAVGQPVPWDEIRRGIEAAGHGGSQLEGVVAGSNPRGISRVLADWRDDLCRPPRVIDDTARFPLEVRVDEPRRVGIDRLLNAVAANAIRPAGRPAIIVDTGTATTIDYVSAEGAFEGGAILPGFELSARALHHYTALLPLISIEELASEPHEPLGRNTRSALRSGLFWGQLGAVRELIARLSVSLSPPLQGGAGRGNDAQSGRGDSALPPRCKGGKNDEHSARELYQRPLLLLTGGGAGLLAEHLPDARWEPHLALQGIALVAAAGEAND